MLRRTGIQLGGIPSIDIIGIDRLFAAQLQLVGLVVLVVFDTGGLVRLLIGVSRGTVLDTPHPCLQLGEEGLDDFRDSDSFRIADVLAGCLLVDISILTSGGRLLLSCRQMGCSRLSSRQCLLLGRLLIGGCSLLTADCLVG